jgi:hypothetical protein
MAGGYPEVTFIIEGVLCSRARQRRLQGLKPFYLLDLTAALKSRPSGSLIY